MPSPKPRLISSFTDFVLVISATFLFSVELIAVIGKVDFITDRLVRLSIFQLWIPVVLGILAGHFFPLPFALFQRRFQIKPFLFLMFLGVGIYVLWYILSDPVTVEHVLDILANYLWAFFLTGYYLGSEFFTRPRYELEE